MSQVLYTGDLHKCSKHGYDPRYTCIGIDDGAVVCCAMGTHYAGCSCRTNKRPAACTTESAQECINEILDLLDDSDKETIGEIKFKEVQENE